MIKIIFFSYCVSRIVVFPGVLVQIDMFLILLWTLYVISSPAQQPINEVFPVYSHKKDQSVI